MVATDPTWINGLTYDGVELRRVQGLAVMTNGTALGARGGIMPGSGALQVSLAGSAITVGAGAAFVYQAGQGVYGVSLSSGGSATLTAAHATLDRIDLVYLRVWDNSVDASGLNKADAVYLAGTASSTPAAPVPPGTQIYLPIATISVPHTGGGSPSVSMIVPKTVAPGGILPDPAAVGYYAGQYRDSGTGLERYNGTAWKPIGPYTPAYTSQVSQPASPATMAFTDFTNAQWPAVTVTFPPSGMVKITIGAAIVNTNTTGSTAWCAWRASGAFVENGSSLNSIGTVNGRTYASRTVIRSSIPGASLTITPQYNFSSVGTIPTVTGVADGQLIVEPMPNA